MRFDYHDGTEQVLIDILGGSREFEDQIAQASKASSITDVAVHHLTAGLSGAAVFLVRRLGPQGRLTPWVVKASNIPELIITERQNNEELVQNVLAAAPQLIPTGSSRLLLFRFGGSLADFHPTTLRAGYARSSPQTIAALMHRIVLSLKPIHKFSDDNASCVHRMSTLVDLQSRLASLQPPLPVGLAERLLESWRAVLAKKDQFPHVRSTAHGDLNAGNVLFEPGDVPALPVVIDFASMRRSKDNQAYPESLHYPFWDFAKLERDLQSRLFLSEAIGAGIAHEDIVGAVRAINASFHPALPASAGPVAKLVAATSGLRDAVRKEYPPSDVDGAYRVVLAYAMLSVIFRQPPDSDVPMDLQRLVASEAAIALLSDDKAAPVGETVVALPLTGDERELVSHLFRYEGRCKVAAAPGEYESLWVPGDLMDMQWGWERTPEEARELRKPIGDRVERLQWLAVVRALVTKGILKELPMPKPKPQRRSSRLYELTDLGWTEGLALASRK